MDIIWSDIVIFSLSSSWAQVYVYLTHIYTSICVSNMPVCENDNVGKGSEIPGYFLVLLHGLGTSEYGPEKDTAVLLPWTQHIMFLHSPGSYCVPPELGQHTMAEYESKQYWDVPFGRGFIECM